MLEYGLAVAAVVVIAAFIGVGYELYRLRQTMSELESARDELYDLLKWIADTHNENILQITSVVNQLGSHPSNPDFH